MTRPSLYVGCGLTHAPKEFTHAVEELKDSLEDDWNVLRFIGVSDGAPEDVYRHDIDANIRTCDAFLAIADHPATGLGWELGVADERNIPTLIVAHIDAHVSRLLLGAGEAREHIKFVRYSSFEEIPSLIERWLAEPTAV